MKKFLAILMVIVFFWTSLEASWADEKQTYRWVLKIRTYEYSSTNNTYNLTQIGSAVVVWTGLLLTNAHVVFNSTVGAPEGFYEICRTIDFRKKAICFTTGELIAYDEASDLAILKFQQPSDLATLPLFQEKIINIGAKVVVYGYPGIWWDNISRTEWNVAGYEEPFYKIDWAIDHGNSGGWAFNKFGELLGIPTKVSSDNAVIGYMVPVMTIIDFIRKKTKWYTKVSLKVPEDFKKFIKDSQIGERSTDSINDSNIKTVSLKKFGLTFLGKLDSVNTFLYWMSMSNLWESSVSFACYWFGWDLPLSELDLRLSGDSIKKYKETKTIIGDKWQYLMRTLESLLSSENKDLINIYDTKNTCAMTINRINVKKNKKIIDQAISFLISGITFKKAFPQTKWFTTQLFNIGRLPAGISIKESPNQGGDTSIELGYFGAVTNTGESLSYISQKKKDTIDNYFLGWKGYYDASPSDINLKPEEYSFETFRKLYEIKYTGKWFTNTVFAIEETKNKKKYVIGTMNYKDESSKDAVTTSAIVYSYPYVTMNWDKKEYHELTYINWYEWGNANAIKSLRDFFANIELIGTSPF